MDHTEAYNLARSLVLKTIQDHGGRNDRYQVRQLLRAVTETGNARVLQSLVNMGEFNTHEITTTFFEEYKEDPEGIDPEIAAMLGPPTRWWDEEDERPDWSKIHKETENNFALASAILGDGLKDALSSSIQVMKFRLKQVDKLVTKLKPFLKEDADMATLRHIVEVHEHIVAED